MKNLIYFIFILVIVSCSGKTKDKNGSSNNNGLLTDNHSIVVFEGTLPCADCEGVQTKLTLFQNKIKSQYSYKLQEVYLGQGNDKTFVTYGKWNALKGTQEDPNAIVYQLAVQNEDPEDADVVNYLVINKNTIKLIDDEMNEYESNLNYTLTKTQQ